MQLGYKMLEYNACFTAYYFRIRHRFRISIRLVLLVLLLNRRDSFQSYAVSNRIWMKFGRIVLQINTINWRCQDFWYDVILSRWLPLYLAATCCCIIPAMCSTIASCPPSACGVSGLLYALQFLIFGIIKIDCLTIFCGMPLFESTLHDLGKYP